MPNKNHEVHNNSREGQESGPSAKLAFRRKEAARLLNISVESLDRLRARGLIKPAIGLSCPLYTLKELQRFLEETSSR